MLSDQESRTTVFAPDVFRDRRRYTFNRTYPIWALTGLLLPGVIGLVIGGTAASAFSGFIFGGLARAFVANQAMWCVGSISHMIGSRPFSTGDSPSVRVCKTTTTRSPVPIGTECGGGNQISADG